MNTTAMNKLIAKHPIPWNDATGVEARPLSKWHEDDGPQLWWKFPIEEAPYCGSPLDEDWPGYHTHFTPIPLPKML